MEKIHESKIHNSSISHDVLILKGSQNIKFKMTYECSNASERFTGELFVGLKWEHFFSILDLGVVVDKGMYIRSEIERIERCEKLQTLGIKFFENMR
jgi:hypothetical protein